MPLTLLLIIGPETVEDRDPVLCQAPGESELARVHVPLAPEP